MGGSHIDSCIPIPYAETNKVMSCRFCLDSRVLDFSFLVEAHVLRPLGRQDSEDLDRLIVAADTELLRLTYLLFDSKWLRCDLLDFWSGYLLSPFADTSVNGAQ